MGLRARRMAAAGQWVPPGRPSVPGAGSPGPPLSCPRPRARQPPVLCFQGSRGPQTRDGDSPRSLPQGDCLTCPRHTPSLTARADSAWGAPECHALGLPAPPADGGPHGHPVLLMGMFISSLGQKRERKEERRVSCPAASHCGCSSKCRGEQPPSAPRQDRDAHLPPAHPWVGNGPYSSWGWSCRVGVDCGPGGPA